MGLINRWAEEASAGNKVINEALKAALASAKSEIKDYLPRKQKPADDELSYTVQMPHEWGSLDRFDDCRNALGIAKDIMEGVLDGYEDEEAQREFVRGVIRDHSVCAASEDLMAIAFPARTEAEAGELTRLESALAEAGGRGVELAERVDALRAKHWDEQSIEDYLYGDERESISTDMPDDLVLVHGIMHWHEACHDPDMAFADCPSTYCRTAQRWLDRVAPIQRDQGERP